MSQPAERRVVLSVDSVRLRYRSGALGVLDVSFEVAEGAIVALFGANGAGKTSSVRAVSGFLRTEGARIIRGSVMFLGRNVTNFEPHRVARLGLASVPERRKIFPTLTVAENLTAIDRHGSVRSRAAAEDRVFSLFPILAARRREVAGRLSGGQRQMLALARAMLRSPNLLIVDEMTLGLHPSLQAPLFGAVRDIADAGTAVLLVDESTAFALDVADYCYLLAGGTIRDQGAPDRFRGNELLAAGYVEA